MRFVTCLIALIAATAAAPSAAFHAASLPLMQHGYVSAVPNAWAISSTFGPRWKTSAGRYDYHRGIDYFAALGSDILAVGAATVEKIEMKTTGGGNTVILRHTMPASVTFHGRVTTVWFSHYLHLQTVLVTLGANVTAGQKIGTMGQTGDTVFTHLHFEARLGGRCSLAYQLENNLAPSATSMCATGFDPHVHPFLFLPHNATGAKTLVSLGQTADSAQRVTFTAPRGHLDLDQIRTDLGAAVFNTREGFNASSEAVLDNLTHANAWLSLRPGVFSSTSETISYTAYFPLQIKYVEFLDIRGNGLRLDFGSAAAAMPIVGALVALLGGTLLIG